ncbi:MULTISPECIES: isocitrate lyase/PEP mutase family protein [Bradyrhizobium]|uniref:2-methylisocitrate lyase-like PEP mutase family enzyme n=1 Tax=Bradyrhizobium algeriense TaxID=634784 RepID=A0ABU8BNM2_9BRAD
MKFDAHLDRATKFLELNRAGSLILPNAWDAASARIFEEAGFPAVGTTSAGIAYARGRRDGQKLVRGSMMHEFASIVAAVSVPVNADIEAGYGASPYDVERTVRGVLDLGIAGVNLEDSRHENGASPLFEIAAQEDRIAAARSAANDSRVPLVINARIDTFLAGVGADAAERAAITAQRGAAYLKAGADIVFIPLLTDPDTIRNLSGAIGGPISLMAMPGAPSAKALFEAGASRVSIGQTAMLSVLAHLRDIASEIRSSGTWDAIADRFYGFAEAEALFPAGR